MPWLNGDTTSSPYLFELDDAGRPLIPLKMLESDREEASFETKLIALWWAKAWLGIPGMIDGDAAVEELMLDMRGQRNVRPPDEGRIIQMASHALSHWREAAIHARTSRAFPWLRFVAIQGCPNCARANSLNGQLLPVTEKEPLPLPGCDAPQCGCQYLQVTEGKRQRMLAEKQSDKS